MSNWSSDLPYQSDDVPTRKDKGKGRATDDDHDRPTTDASSGGLDFTIRFTDGTTEDFQELWVGEREPVKEVKRRLRILRPTLSNRNLRLIWLGKVLKDELYLSQWARTNLKRLKQPSGSELDAAKIIGGAIDAVTGLVEDKGDRDKDGKGKGKERGQQRRDEEVERIVVHCVVGAEMEEGETARGNEEPTATTDGAQNDATPSSGPRGFDRLIEYGFPADEVEQVRQQFHASRRDVGDSGDDSRFVGDDEEHQRALEEQWMEGLTGQDEVTFDDSGPGSNTATLRGLIIGFLFPFLPFFFFRSQVFSKRVSMAIILGMAVNVIFGALRVVS